MTCAPQDRVIPFLRAGVSFYSTQVLVSTGLCVICAGLTWQNRPLGSDCGVKAALVSASNPDHVISGCGSSGLAREEKVTWRHSTGTC